MQSGGIIVIYSPHLLSSPRLSIPELAAEEGS